MILEIALGIVLAVLILAFLPAIIAFGAIAVGIILAIGALYLVWVFVSQKNWTQDDLAAIGIFAAIAVAVVSLAKGAEFVERRTSKKILEGEFICLVVFIPAAAYMLVLIVQDLVAEGAGSYLVHHLVGFAAAFMPIGLCAWRIRRRLR